MKANATAMACLGLAALLVVAAVAVATVAAARQRTAFTQLWLLPDDQPGQRAVRVGVANEELAAEGYALQILVDGAPVWEWPAIELQVHEQWQDRLPLADGSDIGMVEARLYRLADPGVVYRRVYRRLVKGDAG